MPDGHVLARLPALVEERHDGGVHSVDRTVDDEPLIQWAVKSGLQQAGFATIEVGTAAAALAELWRPENRVDLVLLDLKLPDSDDLSASIPT